MGEKGGYSFWAAAPYTVLQSPKALSEAKARSLRSPPQRLGQLTFFVPDFSGDQLAIFISGDALLLTVIVPRCVSPIWATAFKVTYASVLMIGFSCALRLPLLENSF